MAFMETHFFSPSLGFGTDINVFIPTPNADEAMFHKDTSYFARGRRFQVLYLLHGGYGDYTDWLRLTSIERYAQEHKLAVIMPSASNSFYQNMVYGSDYLTYITEELPEMCQQLFPISRKRENTFIAGLSMGGYGALNLALRLPERYACAASLSGALDLVPILEQTSSLAESGVDVHNVFGDQLPEDADLFKLAAKDVQEGKTLPKLYAAVGTEDPIVYATTPGAVQKLREAGCEVTYEEYPGSHEWAFWDAHIQNVLNWLPLTGTSVEED